MANVATSSSQMTTKKALAVLGYLLGFVIITLVVPARWLGMKPVERHYSRLDLSYKGAPSQEIKDGDTWKGLVTSNLGPKEVKKLEVQKPDPVMIKSLNDPDNLTASFSKNLYVTSSYMARDKNTTAEQQQQILNNLVAQEATKIIPTVYTLKDVKVASKEDKNSIRKYGNDVATILKNVVTEKTIRDDFGGVTSYTTSKNSADLVAITKDSARIDAMLNKLTTLSVPPSATLYHLKAINQLATYRDVLFNLSKVDTDPIRATIMLEKYQETMIGALRMYANLGKYFDLQGIAFTGKEAGYVFTIGYTLQ